MTPWRTTPNSAIVLEVIPMFNKKKLEIQAPELLRNRPPTLANPGLPIELLNREILLRTEPFYRQPGLRSEIDC